MLNNEHFNRASLMDIAQILKKDLQMVKEMDYLHGLILQKKSAGINVN